MLAEVVLFFLFFFLAIGIPLFNAKVLITNVQFLFIFLKYFRKVNYPANNHGCNGYDKDSSSCEVFYLANFFVMLRMYEICGFLQGGIHAFGAHNSSYGE